MEDAPLYPSRKPGASAENTSVRHGARTRQPSECNALE